MNAFLNPSIVVLGKRLEGRQQSGLLRKLPVPHTLLDFCSNDYLGFSSSESLQQQFSIAKQTYGNAPLGATGSRLLTGNSIFAEDLEQHIANVQGQQAALLFNSGYTANLGLFSCLPQKGDTIITDELIHCSVIDGCRLSFGKRLKFKHNDLSSLEEKLKMSSGICFVAIESVYSMDGDLAPLLEINTLCQKYGALLIVDEAHAFGVFGKGLVHLTGLTEQVFAVLITFGKALGAHGAIILGSRLLRNYLINFARSFIYSTAMSFSQLLYIQMAYQFLQNQEELTITLQYKIRLFHSCLSQVKEVENHRSAVHAVIIPGNSSAYKASRLLSEQGFAVHPILSPTVPIGKERLRICLHSYNTDEDIKRLCHFLINAL
ncbi:8-amino-7-oxononanoate synthase [Pedobacter sp. CG_S7]|uniref:aminotransferase class I/II-fold pyridoxal phosphate-dependent enzyme n=1 Tax=Pedobacter sp. CG_S7 TaxID=3143930 RepID=UPI00339B7308